MKPILLAVLILLVCVDTSLAEEDRPNVILIMSDDQGVGDYGFMGNKVIRTPALDAMHARSGFPSKFLSPREFRQTAVSLVCTSAAGQSQATNQSRLKDKRC
ncbi:hypothetical protein SH528x_000177 [Novipirellula sp. SH528]|uniref:hypothetical protein n=1 Tax=Novipirellula sp. SH528 TaxID=3454466 RepID=UPI003F9EF84A